MNPRSLAPALVVCLLSSACNCHGVSPAAVGERCGAAQGCEEGLTCLDNICTALGGTGGGSSGAGGGEATGGGSAGAGGGDAGSSGGGTAGSGGGTSGTGGGTAGCGPCNAPPTSCHAQQGVCQGGRCVYDVVLGASCDDGNACTVADTCTASGCTGTPKVCNTPPAAVCVSGTELRTTDATGTCQGGLCVYAPHTVTCGSGGCVNNACQTDPCATVTCAMPPSVCYAAAGTCAGGSCSYPYADGVTCNDNNACTDNDSCSTGTCRGTPKACNSPPADVCENATTLRAYSPVGSCSAGTCSYTPNFITCAAGCANARCNSSGWQKMVSNSTQELYAVWGTSAASVWAGGDFGTMLYFNGSIWQARSSGTQRSIRSIHGTSATNVFASTAGGDILFNDGTGWVKALTYSNSNLLSSYISAVSAVGPKDAYVYARDAYRGYLLHVTNTTGTWTYAVLTSVPDGYTMDTVGIRAYGVNDVYIGGAATQYWDGGTMETLPGSSAPSLVTRLFGTASRTLFAVTLFGANAYKVSPSGTWTVLNTAYSGNLTGVAGSSDTRVFISGGTSTPSPSGTGALLFYDGQGITQELLPSGTASLNDVWAAPSGEVFAVGAAGVVLRGP